VHPDIDLAVEQRPLDLADEPCFVTAPGGPVLGLDRDDLGSAQGLGDQLRLRQREGAAARPEPKPLLSHRDSAAFVAATPLSDRILTSYKDHLTYWVEQRMALDGDAATQLNRAQAMLAERADVVQDEGFPRVADGLRRATGDPLWTALAARIAESALP